MLDITEKAQVEIQRILTTRSEKGLGLRLAVRKGGCAGWQYEMAVANQEDGDVLIGTAESRVIVAADSIAKLKGSLVDFSDDLTDAGFKITNPSARRSCGCGTSFEPEDEPEGSGAEDGEVCGKV